jgi:hypothetical protein
MMTIIDVRLDNLRGNVPYGTEKLTGTPKMSFSEMPSQPRMSSKKFIGATAFKKLKGFANAHSRPYLNKHMDMIWFDLKFKDFHSPLLRNIAKKLLAMLPNNLKLKRVFRIFRLPHEVVSILSYAVSMVVKSFHFMSPPRFFYGANARSSFDGECAGYATHSSFYFSLRNSLWRLGTRAKARGILCM